MKIEIYPLEKVVIDGTSVCFGMEQAVVESEIGKGLLVGERYYYYNNDMAIEYSADGKIEFIEFLGGVEGSLRPVIYGMSAFDATADELTELLIDKNAGEVDDSEQGHLLLFLNISVGIYREMRPEDVAEMMEEMEKANHWATIGVGVEDYYKR